MPKRVIFALIASFAFVILATTMAYRTLERGRVSFHSANRLKAGGFYEQAASHYYNALRAGLYEEAVIDELISLYYRTGNNEILMPLKKAPFVTDYGAETLELIAEAEFNMGHFYDSANTYRLAASMDPGRKYLKVKLARSLFFAGLPEESASSYKLFLNEGDFETNDNCHF